MVARGGPGAMAMIAVGDPGSFLRVPQMYMRKMAVGPVAREHIDLRRSVADNVLAIAEAYGRNPNDVTAIVLDRPRHHDLIEELRGSGARIKLIQDGDVTAAITASVRGTNDHLAIGIGGARQTVLTAAALRCLGGELQAQFWPVSRTEITQAREYGFEDMEKVFTLEELAPSDVVVAATGSRTATSCAACATSRTRPARNRSSCAPAATGCGSSTGSTSSPASAARRYGCSADEPAARQPKGPDEIRPLHVPPRPRTGRMSSGPDALDWRHA